MPDDNPYAVEEKPRDQVGPLIRKAREQRDWTSEKLSEVSGISVATIYRLENGESAPYGPVLQRLAAALDLDVAQLQAKAGELRSLRGAAIKAGKERKKMERQQALAARDARAVALREERGVAEVPVPIPLPLGLPDGLDLSTRAAALDVIRSLAHSLEQVLS